MRNTKIFAERLRDLRINAGLSQEALGQKCGVTKSSINMYERGERSPKVETLEAIADYFNVDMEYLRGTSDIKNKYRESLGGLPDNIIPLPTMKKIPLIGDIACGTPILAVQNIEDELFAPEDINCDFALRCKGDSMIGANIMDGDVVYIREQAQVNDGQIAAVLIEDEATLKRVYYDHENNMVTLIAENPAVPPRIYQGEALDHIRVLGLAVGLTRKL